MKTLTALTTAIALVAGISAASAAGTMNNGSAASSNNLTATGSAYCNKSKTTGTMDCKFASMADCQKEATPQGGSCVQNPKAATTGSGSSSGMNNSMNKTEKKQ